MPPITRRSAIASVLRPMLLYMQINYPDIPEGTNISIVFNDKHQIMFKEYQDAYPIFRRDYPSVTGLEILKELV